jgi:hypothetical protein
MKDTDLIEAVERAAAVAGGWATPRQIVRYLPGSSRPVMERRLGDLASKEKLVRAVHQRRASYRVPRSTREG